MTMKKTATATVDFPTELLPQPVADKKKLDDKWDGQSTRIPLFRPMIRNQVTTGPNEPCLNCLAEGIEDRTHQFHLRASKGSDGSWYGPDADHLRDLIGEVRIERARDKNGNLTDVVRTYVKGGVVAGTEVERVWIEERRRDAERQGVGDFPAWDLDGLRQAMARELLEDGKTINPGIERDLRREEAAQLRRAVEEGLAQGVGPMVELIRELLAERSKA